MAKPKDAAIRQVANWLAECLTCEAEHKPHPHPSGPHYADTYAHRDDGHTYRPRNGTAAGWLRAQLTDLPRRIEEDT